MMDDVIKMGYCPNGDQSFDEVCIKMREEMLNQETEYLKPIILPNAQSPTDEAGNVASIETPQPDFSFTDNPQFSATDTRELPTWGFPYTLRNIVDEVCNGYQCNRDFVVASMMVATSTMLGKRVQCKFANHINYPTLWVAIVGGTASGKTAPLSFFFKPIELMEREAYANYQREMTTWNDTDGAKGEKPTYHHRLINNPSDESVLHELSINESICWKTDELRTMFDGFGKYSKSGGGTIVGNLLSIFNNIDVNITRATSEPKYITEPNLNIIGGIQPNILKRIMGNNSGFVDDGLFQRFLFVYPDPTDTPQFADEEISNVTRTDWSDIVKMLSKVDGIELHETEEAKKLHIDTINRWRNECNADYRNIDAMISLVRKLEIHLCRWCIVVAILNRQTEITADNMKYSIECMEYFKLCGEKTFCLIANPEQKPKEPTKGEVFKLLKKWYPNINQSLLGKALGITQQAISKFFK